MRLLVSRPSGSLHRSFRELPELLQPGDLRVVNESATLPASLSAHGPSGSFPLNLSTYYGGDIWLAEPRWDIGRPGPVPLGSVRSDPTRGSTGSGSSARRGTSPAR
ncbi:MAG: S-adenosylmethionine:tRNA ribosyltransferase-isomerase [Thermoplasmata archaeon]